MRGDFDEDEYDEYDDDDFDDDCCFSCHGEGWCHDCGEDTCCCANPDEDDLVPCDECGGEG